MKRLRKKRPAVLIPHDSIVLFYNVYNDLCLQLI